MDKYLKALDIFNKHMEVGSSGKIIITMFNTQKEGVLAVEQEALEIKKKLSEIGHNEKLKPKSEALRFLAVIGKTFHPLYYTIRGCSTDAKEGNTIVQEILYKTCGRIRAFKTAFEATYPIFLNE